MVFGILNLFLTIFLVFETIFSDKIENKFDDGTNPIIVNILVFAITSGLYTVFYALRSSVTPALFTLLMRFCFVLEGCMLVNIVFCFIYYAWKYSSGMSYLIKCILYAVVIYFVFFRFKEIKISISNGVEIRSNFIFSGIARSYLPLTWYSLYNIIFKFFLPLCGCLIMLVRNEMKANKLDRHKGYIYTLGLIATWFSILCFNKLVKTNVSYSILHFYIYLPIMIIIPYGSWIQSAPSGRSLVSFYLKALFLYLFPSVFLGFSFMVVYYLNETHGILISTLGFACVIVACIVVNLIYKRLHKNKFIHSSDYAASFEKDLAAIDYNGEMDEISDEMFNIFNRNAESSSMAVYINGGNATFENAYTSNGKKYKIDHYESLFESLLNIGRNVVVCSELETVHILSPVKVELSEFFKNTSSDALFILNEGRDVHGIIILGEKAGSDHYKEYDLKVFTKLYSYFFVFGYYMRNISNKEIIGTVNRELRMSSQIITSIQENMDQVKNPRLDAGCIMVPAHNIGGEFVDMIRLTDSRHLFVMGDLSGKGIAASMSMVILKAIIRAYLVETHDFKQLVIKVNQFIRYNLQKGTIFAGMFAIINFDNDTMYYINCGIPAMFLYTEAYNNVIEIQGGGHILGFVSDISPYISVKQIKLHKNDIVLACTDGLIESHSLRGELFGKDRVQRNMIANAMYPAQRMAQFEYDDLMRFMSHEMEDDVSVLVMKYLATNESELEDAKAIKADLLASMEEFKKDKEIDNINEIEDCYVPIAEDVSDEGLEGVGDDVLEENNKNNEEFFKEIPKL